MYTVFRSHLIVSCSFGFRRPLFPLDDLFTALQSDRVPLDDKPTSGRISKLIY